MRRYFLVAARYSRASGQSAASIEELVCRRQVASVGARAPPDGGGLQVITNRIDGERGGVPDQGARSRGRINKADINNSRYLASQMGEPGAHPIWPIALPGRVARQTATIHQPAAPREEAAPTSQESRSSSPKSLNLLTPPPSPPPQDAGLTIVRRFRLGRSPGDQACSPGRRALDANHGSKTAPRRAAALDSGACARTYTPSLTPC